MMSLSVFSNPFFQYDFQLAHSQQQISISINSIYSSNNEISNVLLERFKEIVLNSIKEIVLNQPSSSSSNNVVMPNSSITVAIGVVTTKWNSGFWIREHFKFEQYEG